MSPWLGQLNIRRARDAPLHNMRIEVAGATGSDWLVAATLLLWRSDSLALRSAGPMRVVASPVLADGAAVESSSECFRV